MKFSPYEFDPHGDTILILERPNEQVLFSCEEAQLASQKALAPGEKREQNSELHINVKSEFDNKSTGDPTKQKSAVVMRVSSQHLSLASSFFRKMLRGPWQEGNKNSSASISASEWDVEAFKILLDIIHGHHLEVPKTLSLEMFAKFSVIVDYYECHEIVDIFVDRWLQERQSGLPTEYNNECILWLCISWVFSREEIFHSMTNLVLRDQRNSLELIHLPISNILENIGQRRQEIIPLFLQQLQKLEERLCNKYVCAQKASSYECSCMLLGALRRQTAKICHLSPPFDGFSIKEIMERLADIKSPRWFAVDACFHRSSYAHSCTLETHLKPILDDINERIDNFKIATPNP